MNDDAQLLRCYAEAGSESAFSELVSRHIDLVYSAALRQVGGDAHLAQDVTQTVFADLARKARPVSRHEVLTGWLYQATRYAASKVVRTERRRATREKEAVAMQELSSDASWERLRPVLDEAMSRLGAKDRDAVLLRYFEGKELRAVGDALGTNEEAARKRVSRALERLRRYLTGRGVTLSAATLATALAGSAVQAAPAGLAGTISSAVIAGAAVAAGSTFNLLNLMSITKLKTGLLGVAVVVGAGTPILVQQQSVARLRAENQELRARSEQLDPLRERNQQVAGLLAALEELERLRKEVAELHRLRAEVARLRQEREDAAQLQAENARLKQYVTNRASAEDDKPASTPEQDQFKREAIDRLNFTKQWLLSFIIYAENHEGRVPQKFSDVDGFDVLAGSIEGLSPSDFEIVYDGKLRDLQDPSRTIILREKEARINPDGKLTKAYGFADGHSEIHRPLDGNFERFEKERMVAGSGQ